MPYVQLLLPPEFSDTTGQYIAQIPQGSLRPLREAGDDGYWPGSLSVRVNSSQLYYSNADGHFYIQADNLEGTGPATYQSGYYGSATDAASVLIRRCTIANYSGSSITCVSPSGLVIDEPRDAVSLTQLAGRVIYNPSAVVELTSFMAGQTENVFSVPQMHDYLRYATAWQLRARLGRILAGPCVDMVFYMECKKAPDKFWQAELPRIADTDQGFWSALRNAGTMTLTTGNKKKTDKYLIKCKEYRSWISLGNNLRTQLINKLKTYQYVSIDRVRKIELPWDHQITKSLPTTKRSILRAKDLSMEE